MIRQTNPMSMRYLQVFHRILKRVELLNDNKILRLLLNKERKKILALLNLILAHRISIAIQLVK
jgi:hypothetical protein